MFLITGSWRFPSCVHLFKHLSYQTVVLFPSNIKQEKGSKHIISKANFDFYTKVLHLSEVHF